MRNRKQGPSYLFYNEYHGYWWPSTHVTSSLTFISWAYKQNEPCSNTRNQGISIQQPWSWPILCRIFCCLHQKGLNDAGESLLVIQLHSHWLDELLSASFIIISFVSQIVSIVNIYHFCGTRWWPNPTHWPPGRRSWIFVIFIFSHFLIHVKDGYFEKFLLNLPHLNATRPQW